MNFLEITSESEESFKVIAQQLFDNYAINTNSGCFRIIEMEFYWHSKTHPDMTVYKRKHIHTKTGDWFFHYSGVDISLGNSKLDSYGGILIRSIQDLKSKNLYNGPQVTAMRLFSGSSAFKNSIQTEIISQEFPKSTITSLVRVGLGNNAKPGDFNSKRYNFKIPYINKQK